MRSSFEPVPPGHLPGKEISNDYCEASIKKIAECVEHRDRDQSYAGDEETGNPVTGRQRRGQEERLSAVCCACGTGLQITSSCAHSK
jgi:hypothetical protein